MIPWWNQQTCAQKLASLGATIGAFQIFAQANCMCEPQNPNPSCNVMRECELLEDLRKITEDLSLTPQSRVDKIQMCWYKPDRFLSNPNWVVIHVMINQLFVENPLV